MNASRPTAEGAHIAAAALAEGRSVILPTQCGYLLAGAPVSTTRLAAVARTRSVRLDRLFASAEQLLEALAVPGGGVRPIHRRLVARLAPGPVVFTREGRADGLRAPDEPHLAAVLQLHRSTVAAQASGETPEGLVALELVAGGNPVREADEAVRIAAAWGEAIGATIDAGPSRFREPATVIELRAGQPAFRVIREGAYESRFVAKQAERTILFVCTGNTCRSPMAEALAGDLLREMSRDAAGVTPIRAVSAGAGAERGHPATPEAMDALRTLGVPAPRHASRPLTRQLIAEADAIFGMTRSHLRAVLELDPDAEGKAALVDPAGRDVPDPIGQPQSVYTETAKLLREHIRSRLKEMDA